MHRILNPDTQDMQNTLKLSALHHIQLPKQIQKSGNSPVLETMATQIRCNNAVVHDVLLHS